MTYAQLPAPIRTLADQTLTQAQLEAWKLELAGWSQWQIAYRLGITRSAVRDRLRSASQSLDRAGIHQNPDGTWATRTEQEVA